MEMRKPLILASKSPRRRDLLSALGLAFTVDVSTVDETPRPGEPPNDMVIRLSRAKASTVAARHPQALVLAADTVVVLESALLGKPADARQAIAMLRNLRGRTHQVYTAVSLAHHGGVTTRLSVSNVTMRAYTDDEIMAYVSSGDPLDKAGAYAIQHPGFAPVARWDGCYSSIMGLPLGVVAALLTDAGVEIPVEVPTSDCHLRGDSHL